MSKKVSDLYLAYIRFVNKIYFREVTAYEQGIELYDMLRHKIAHRCTGQRPRWGNRGICIIMRR